MCVCLCIRSGVYYSRGYGDGGDQYIRIVLMIASIVVPTATILPSRWDKGFTPPVSDYLKMT